MELSNRMEKIISLIPRGSVVADIGTDHCQIPVELIERGIAKKVIAVELNHRPYNKAKEYIFRLNMADKIDLRLGFGLKPIQFGEVDTAIIAGMGGETILSIIKESLQICQSLAQIILQPMSTQEELRRGLENLSFTIIDEKLAKEEDHFYEIIKIVAGYSKIEKPIYYEVGPILTKKPDELFKEYITSKINRFKRLEKELIEINTDGAKTKLKEVRNRIREYMEVI